MARPLSIDLRERAAAAVLQGGLSRLRAGRTNESAPKAGRSQNSTGRASGSDLGRLDLQELAGACDRDRPRLHGLGNLAHELDVQEPVLQARALDLDIVGELEATLEGSRGDALVEHLAGLFLGVGLLLAVSRIKRSYGLCPSCPSSPATSARRRSPRPRWCCSLASATMRRRRGREHSGWKLS
jgi:hypothetical protein